MGGSSGRTHVPCTLPRTSSPNLSPSSKMSTSPRSRREGRMATQPNGIRRPPRRRRGRPRGRPCPSPLAYASSHPLIHRQAAGVSSCIRRESWDSPCPGCAMGPDEPVGRCRVDVRCLPGGSSSAAPAPTGVVLVRLALADPVPMVLVGRRARPDRSPRAATWGRPARLARAASAAGARSRFRLAGGVRSCPSRRIEMVPSARFAGPRRHVSVAPPRDVGPEGLVPPPGSSRRIASRKSGETQAPSAPSRQTE